MVERKPHWNLRPVHQAPQTIGTTSTHFPVSYLNSSRIGGFTSKAFQTFTAIGAASSIHYPRTSGFQYLTVGVVTLIRSFEEDVASEDEQSFNYTKFIEEDFTLVDFTFDGTSRQEEDVAISDTFVTTIIPTWDELVPSTDSLTRSITQDEDVPILDEFQFNWTRFFEEDVASSDAPQSAIVDQAIYSLTTTIQESAPPYSSLNVSSEVYLTDIASVSNCIIPFLLSPVVSISAMPSASTTTPVLNITGYNLVQFADPVSEIVINPFEPTVILGGQTFAIQTSTAPPDTYVVTPNTYFVQWLNPQIGTVNSCQLLNFDIELDRQGGNFSFATSSNPGYALGDTISILGLTGAVTEMGRIWSNNQVGYLVKGIFGSRNLNKQLNILAGGSNSLFAYLTNSLLSNQALEFLHTFSGAAMAIASIAGINLSVSLPAGDPTLIDFTIAEGDTALSALNSIAAEFGGTLLWNGGNSYQIAGPNVFRGLWEVPDQSVVTPSGVQFADKLDIGTGISGTGFFMVPVTTFFDPRVYGLPSTVPLTAFPQVQKVATCGQAITTEKPLWIVDLPLDTEEAWLQILVTTENLEGARIPDPNASIVAAQAITNDPSVWTSLGSPSIAGPTVKLVNKGGALGAIVPQAQIGSNLFPTNDTITNGNFIMSVGVTRNDQNALFEAAVNSRNTQLRNILARLVGTFKFVQTYSGTISTQFFGSIPLPGMWGRATVCGQPVEGIIESVSFTYPGIINVQVAQYAEINYIKNFYFIDLTTISGLSGENIS